MEIRRLEPSAGAEWLLGAIRLFGRSPAGFGLMALTYSVLMLVVTLVAQGSPWLAGPLQLVFMLVGPLLLAGMIFAAHVVDHGGQATPRHLLAAMRGDKAGRIVSTLLPQFAVLLLCVLLLVVVVGPDKLEAMTQAIAKLQQNAQNRMQVDEALLAAIPFGRIAIWVLLSLIVGLVSLFFTLTVIPDMFFNDVGLFAAMQRCYRACTANLGAMCVFIVLGFVMMVVVSVGAGVVLALFGALSPAAMLVGQALFNGLTVAFVSIVFYVAWRELIGESGPGQRPAETGIAV